MILNEFFNLPQVFEKDMEKDTQVNGQDVDVGVVVKKLQNFVSNAEQQIQNADYDQQVRYATTVRDRALQALDMIAQGGNTPEAASAAFKFMQTGKQGVAEGFFGSKPNPVLPIVDKIAKVAGGLTPQNVETGKQIIQANARDIIRMLSPQDKAGIDVIEGTRERLSNLHDKIRKEKGLPDPKEYLKIAQQKKKEIADLKAQNKNEVGEGKGDYVPPKEADYGDKYQAMVKRVGEKARAQEKARQQQQPKQPVRESRRALLKQIIQS